LGGKLVNSHKVLGITAVLVIVLAITAVIAFHSYGLIEISLSVGLAVSATVVALLIKIVCQGIVTRTPEFHKQGYDLCIMTLATTLTAIGAEFARAYTAGHLDRPQILKVGIIFLIFVGALLLTLLTTYNSRRFEDSKVHAAANRLAAPKESYASFLSYISGMGIFVFNIYVIARRN
jgi:uncharacterized membrane protein YfcA